MVRADCARNGEAFWGTRTTSSISAARYDEEYEVLQYCAWSYLSWNCLPNADTGILKDLVESHDDAHLSELADRALLLLRSLPSLDYEEREQRALATQLHTSGISLWNRTVTLKSAGAISLNLNAQSRLMAPAFFLEIWSWRGKMEKSLVLGGNLMD